MTTPAKANTTRKPQIRPRLRAAVGLIVGDGLTIGEAADRSGMAYEALRVALHKPHVQAFLSSLKRERVGLESARSFHRVTELRDTAASEKVQLDAAKVILTVAGDMEGERQAPSLQPLAIQIIVNERWPAPPVADSRGVIEAPAYSPVQHGAA